ncbi:hypothetical protein D3C71_2061420 [compost metagenome]
MLNDIRHRFLDNQEQLMLNRFRQLALQFHLLNTFKSILAAIVRKPFLQRFEQIAAFQFHRTQLRD